MNRLDEIEARTRAATEGPWEWAGKQAESFPQGENSLIAQGDLEREVIGSWGHDAWGVDVENPADAEFIAHARTDVPALVAVARFALSQHSKDETHNECGHCADSYGEDGWPCSTVREIHRLLGEDA